MMLAVAMQAQSSRGSLRGTVQDSSGARIASARILVESVDSSATRNASCDDRGEFRVDDLVPGAYRVKVTAPGFTEASADVSILINVVREIFVTVKPLALPEKIN